MALAQERHVDVVLLAESEFSPAAVLEHLRSCIKTPTARDEQVGGLLLRGHLRLQLFAPVQDNLDLVERRVAGLSLI
jgi:hypothetical protein